MVTVFLPILAHGDEPHTWSELARDWEWNPLVLALLFISAVLYARGYWRLRHASHLDAGIKRWEAASFWTGLAFVFVALVSPLHAWGHTLFAAHMVQHEVLMLICAPLIVLGRPLILYLWAFPLRWSRFLAHAAHTRPWRKTWEVISHPFSAWLLHAAALWIWHLPSLFQATLDSDVVHTLQHASFFGTAILFWWAVTNGRHRLTGYGMAVLYMFTTALHSGLLGALITFARRTWYPAYDDTASWNLTPLEDQQLGGLIMWIPAGVVYVVAGLLFLVGWLRESERRARKWEGNLLIPTEAAGQSSA